MAREIKIPIDLKNGLESLVWQDESSEYSVIIDAVLCYNLIKNKLNSGGYFAFLKEGHILEVTAQQVKFNEQFAEKTDVVSLSEHDFELVAQEFDIDSEDVCDCIVESLKFYLMVRMYKSLEYDLVEKKNGHFLDFNI